MPRSIIIPDVQQLTDHYLRQQRDGNIAGYRGTRMQRGYGIGGIFRSLARFAMPLFKKSADSVGKRALKAATEVGQDVLDGKNFKEYSLKPEFVCALSAKLRGTLLPATPDITMYPILQCL